MNKLIGHMEVKWILIIYADRYLSNERKIKNTHSLSVINFINKVPSKRACFMMAKDPIALL